MTSVNVSASARSGVISRKRIPGLGKSGTLRIFSRTLLESEYVISGALSFLPAEPTAHGDDLRRGRRRPAARPSLHPRHQRSRSEEHTSELQSRGQLLCRRPLEKKNTIHRQAWC